MPDHITNQETTSATARMDPTDETGNLNSDQNGTHAINEEVRATMEVGGLLGVDL
jgi:hypothetical protein